MKQKIFSLFIILFSFFQLFPVVQSYALMPLPPINNSNQTLFGENQYYTVTFRGNGEAIVTMKAIITNNNSTPLSSVTLHLPSNITPKNVIGYQVIAQPQCVQYSNEPVAKPTCLQYQQPDYQYVSNDTKYQNLSIGQTNNVFTFALPTPLKQNDTGSYLLSYRTFNYVQKNFFGAYDFTFQSLKVDDQINTLQIGIATDSDLFIKGAKGTVNYDTAATMKSLAVPQADGAVQSQRFNDFYNQIGQGTIIKNASNLEPLESYTAKGMYADTGIKLYGQEITTTIIAILAILFIIFGIITFILRRQKNTKSDKKSGNTKLFIIATGVSFGSVLLASGYTVVILLLSSFLNSNNYYAYNNNMFATLLITALSGAVYLFLLFIPAIIMTVKKGLVWGGIMLGLTIMWAVIACVILFGAFYLFSNSTTTPPSPIIRPLMMSGQGTSVPAGAMEKAQ
ncbi:MAG TPA: hypothetical protein VLG12_03170 [Candidatus Saccharimonadales bacterium]|nr:hypothetical protein [Candidatus Saccharimonadales bacterium]